MTARALLFPLLAWGAAASATPPALLPAPGHLFERTGAGFDLSTARVVTAPKQAADWLAPEIKNASHTGPVVRFVRKPGFAAEGYRLETGPKGATISASDDAGLFYGAVTLWQLGPHVPAVTIDDAPRFRWRGLMLDSARHFQSPAFIHWLIDWMAANKLNRLHWHLVDDQGWRLEIKKYPRLTEVSAWRRPATSPGAPPLPVTGGFYTQDQVREIVAYAAARSITIVPEIEMPGHATAAIRAYPELGMGVPLPEGVWSDWGVFPWLYNPSEKTFGFLQDVLDEVMALFPGKDIHTGGDEATKEQWRAGPAVQAKIKELGLKDENALQGWFTARIGKYLAAHGRRLVGWDEILEGGVPGDAIVMSWRGIDGAIIAAKAGHDTVLSPAPTLYFDNRQGSGPQEPPGRGNTISLAEVLAFDPLPSKLTADEQRHILGLQGNLWTEHVRTEERTAWMLFPRAAAIAEIGWAGPQRGKDDKDFLTRLVPQLKGLEALGLKPATSAFAVTARYDRDTTGVVHATLANQSGLAIRYTLDGSAVTSTSPTYTVPLAVAGPQRLRAATELNGDILPGALDDHATPDRAETRASAELETCGDAVRLDLEDDYPATGPRARFVTDILRPCWIWHGAPLKDAVRIALDVGQRPFNFQIGADLQKIKFRAPATPAGEFEVRAGCDGAVLATLPLAPAVGNPGVTRLEASLPPQAATTDLCISYTARGPDPLWGIARATLVRR